MAVGQKLALRQSQSLSLTPGLRQSIEVMLLSAQDLTQLVERKLDENPFLERGDDGPRPESDPSDYLAQPPTDATWDGTQADFGRGDEVVAARPSLELHLAQQARMTFADPAELAIALALITEMDEAGYLPARPLEGQVAGERLAPVLRRLQRLAPPGVLARSLAECLALQLEERGLLDDAFRTLLENLPLVAAGKKAKLLRIAGLEPAALDERLRQLRLLDPKPALAFDPPETAPAIPDLLVSLEAGSRPRVSLNTAALPRLRVNLETRAALRPGLRRQADKRYVSERSAEAGWLVRSLARRGRSLLALGEELVARQEDFFREGFPALRPLTRRDMARALGLSEASISRLVANKYLAAPQGVLPLARFFSPAVADGAASQEAVKDRLARLIAEEPSGAPLSDRQLAERLSESGLHVARRTIAKYRKILHIPGAVGRRNQAGGGPRRIP